MISAMSDHAGIAEDCKSLADWNRFSIRNLRMGEKSGASPNGRMPMWHAHPSSGFGESMSDWFEALSKRRFSRKPINRNWVDNLRCPRGVAPNGQKSLKWLSPNVEVLTSLLCRRQAPRYNSPRWTPNVFGARIGGW